MHSYGYYFYLCVIIAFIQLMFYHIFKDFINRSLSTTDLIRFRPWKRNVKQSFSSNLFMRISEQKS